MRHIRFELAGKPRGDTELVFLTSEHRSHKIRTTVFHRNDYHTTVNIPKEEFKKQFKFNFSTWIYDNLTGLTWKDLGEIADIETIKL